jgi:hypothetical protein
MQEVEDDFDISTAYRHIALNPFYPPKQPGSKEEQFAGSVYVFG